MLVAVVEAIGPHCCHTSTTATYCPGFYALAITDETHAQSVASMDYATPHRCASDRSQVGLWLHSPQIKIPCERDEYLRMPRIVKHLPVNNQ